MNRFFKMKHPTAKLRQTFVIILLLISCKCYGQVTLPSNFSATLVHSARGKSFKQQLYVNGSKMRSVIQIGDKEAITILDKANAAVIVLDQRTKTFSEYPYRAPKANPSLIDFDIVNDPTAKVEELGVAELEG